MMPTIVRLLGQWLNHSPPPPPRPTRQGSDLEVPKEKRLEKQKHWTLHYTCTWSSNSTQHLVFCHNATRCLETLRSLLLSMFLLIIGKRHYRGRVQKYSVLSYDNKWGEIISINNGNIKPIELKRSLMRCRQFPLHMTMILVNNNNDHRWQRPSHYHKSKCKVQTGYITFDSSDYGQWKNISDKKMRKGQRICMVSA